MGITVELDTKMAAGFTEVTSLVPMNHAWRSSATMRTNTDTCAHTQVSTLPPADRIGLKNQCTATDTFKL